MSEPRVIKKYPNRRLYDTALSKYITLEDVRRLVRDRVEFVVRDAHTDEDLTRSILLQVIAEQEAGGEPKQQFRRQLDQIMTQDAVGAMSELTKRNLALWREMQGAVFGNGPDAKPPPNPSRTAPKRKRKGKKTR
jgi:polyhydroxyalkanoate synthesis repressor PhaR